VNHIPSRPLLAASVALALAGSLLATSSPAWAQAELPSVDSGFGEYRLVPRLGDDVPYAGPATPTSMGEVSMTEQVEELLGPEARATLADQGFVVVPEEFRLFHHAYDEQFYVGTPVFVSSDAAFHAWQAGLHADTSLEIFLPAARAVFAGTAPEGQAPIRSFLQTTLTRIAHGTADESVRVRWLTGRVGRELVELAGPMDAPDPDAAAGAESGAAMGRPGSHLDETERHLLQLLTQGRTNAEIAAELDLAEDEVAQRLTRLFTQLGASSRAEATSLAFRGLATVGSR
jgi:DNA-binding NarL/FixJ family response regulator